MADLILNLASLKAKADAAGVATTATTTNPNLCPQKSSIAGYVTNGATTVTISGTWANNLLVPAANVSVTKTVTSTATVYRNVSVGTSSASDIPAAGGQVRASATVSYLQTTRTYYSDGTSTDGTWTNQSATIYGAYVSASSKGTTVSSRSSTGKTSTPSGSVAGATRTGSAVTIYLAANNITAIAIEYGSYSYWCTYDTTISSSGGSLLPNFRHYSKLTFASGSTLSLKSASDTYETYSSWYASNGSWTVTYTYSFSGSATGFTVGTTDGKVTATTNLGGARTVTVTATVTAAITYGSSYSSLSKPSNKSLTHYPVCTQLAHLGGTGFTLILVAYLASPKVAFKNSSGTAIYTLSALNSSGTFTYSSLVWQGTGPVHHVDVTYNDMSPKNKYITITNNSSTTYLAKKALSTSSGSTRNLALSTQIPNNYTGTIKVIFSPS